MFWRGCVQLRQESYGFWIQGGEYCALLLQERRCRAGATGNTECFWLFLACILAGASLGMARGGKEKGILDREESAARTMNGARILVRGEIKKAEQKEDTLTLIWNR